MATVKEAARHFRVHIATVRRWIRVGCPCEAGSVGRNHGSRLNLAEVQGWLLSRRLPMVAEQNKIDLLKIVATALYDVVKRDGLAGQVLPAERVVLTIYERLYRNVKETPLEAKDLPDEMKRLYANYLDSVEHRPFHGGDE